MPREHPIQRYLRRRKLSLTAFSKLSGIDRSTLSRLISGERRLTMAHLKSIHKATGGKLTLVTLCPDLRAA